MFARLCIAAAAGLIVGACAGARNTPDPVSSSGLSIVSPDLPLEVLSYRLTDTFPHDDPRVGTSYRYEDGKGWWSTVTIYPLSEDRRAVADPWAIVEGEARTFAEVMAELRRQGQIDTIVATLETRDSVVVEGRMFPGHYIGLLVAKGRQARTEILNVFLTERGFLKVRQTLPATDRWLGTDADGWGHAFMWAMYRSRREGPRSSPPDIRRR